MRAKHSILFALVIAGAALAQDAPPTYKFSGMFRYRGEVIEIEDKETQERERIAARFGMENTISPSLKVNLRFATSTADPRSINETMTNLSGGKALKLELACFNWADPQVPGLAVTGGKIENPNLRPGGSELIWDGDVTPEGMAFKYGGKFEALSPLANISLLWLGEREEDADPWLIGTQIGSGYKVNDDLQVTLGGGYQHYTNLKGFKLMSYTGAATATAYGNSKNADSTYKEDYNLVEGFVEVGMKVAGLPLSLYGNYVTNIAVSDSGMGYLAGLTLGKVVDKGSWSVRYAYRYAEKNAVFGSLTDADYGATLTNSKTDPRRLHNSEGTDNTAHKVTLAYGLAKNVSVAVTGFIVSDMLLDESFQRVYADLNFKF